MTNFIATGMRTKLPEGAHAVNTCIRNDTAETGSGTAWAWSNPTNRMFPATHKNDPECSAVSLECLWQGTKIRTAGTGPDQQILRGYWRRGKGRRPIGAWNGPNRPLITSPGEARREIYLPAFVNQLHRQLTENVAAREMLLDAIATHDTIYLRDFDTGQGVDRNGPMSHAWVMATILNGDDAKFGKIDNNTADKIAEIQRIAKLRQPRML
jgi:hypothetical protein